MLVARCGNLEVKKWRIVRRVVEVTGLGFFFFLINYLQNRESSVFFIF